MSLKRGKQDYATQVNDKEKVTAQANARAKGINTAKASAKLVRFIESLSNQRRLDRSISQLTIGASDQQLARLRAAARRQHAIVKF